MGVIEERTAADGKSRYRGKIRIKGRPALSRTFKRKTDAKRWEQRTEADIRRGKTFPVAETQRRTPADLIETYLPKLPDSSDRRNRVRQLSWWLNSLGAYRLVELRAPLVKETAERIPGSPATRNRYVAALSAAISFAVRELEWLETNPVAKIRREKEPRGRVRFLDEEERHRLLEACRESADSRLYVITALAIYTGMRRGEILRLRWNDVDLDLGRATIHESKNNERRRIPVAGLALGVLREHSQTRPSGTEFVFSNAAGIAAWNRRAWDKVVKQAGLVTPVPRLPAYGSLVPPHVWRFPARAREDTRPQDNADGHALRAPRRRPHFCSCRTEGEKVQLRVELGTLRPGIWTHNSKGASPG